MAIDLRLRPPYKSFLDIHVYAEPVEESIPSSGFEIAPPPSVKERSMELLFQEMDEAGVTHGVIPGRDAIPPYLKHTEEDLYDLAREYPDRFICLPNVNPTKPKAAFEVIERAANTPGIPGIHMEPGWCDPAMYADDPRIMPIYEECAEKGLIVAISGGGFLGPDFGYVNPIYIQRVARAFQKLPIMVCHGGWPWIDVMLGVAYRCPNLYISPDMYMTMEGSPGAERWAQAANYFLKERLVFGTAYPARSFRQSLKYFHTLPFKDDEVKENVLTHNAARFFGVRVP